MPTSPETKTRSASRTKSQEVADLAEKIGLPLIPWQRWVLDDLLAVDDAHTWRKKTALILVARQNGKTHLARMLILSHLFLWGSKNVLGMSSNRRKQFLVFYFTCIIAYVI